MYSRKQIDKLTERAEPKRRPSATDLAPSEPIPDALWQSLLDDPRAAGKPTVPIQQCRLADIESHMLRVECSRCSRIVEMQKAEAIRYFGADAIWKNVGQRCWIRLAPIAPAAMKRMAAGQTGLAPKEALSFPL